MFFYESGAYSARSDEQARRYSASYATSADQRINRDCRDGASTRACIREIIEAEHEQRRSEDNLKWQGQAAEWAWWAVVIGVGQLIVGAIGIGFVIASLRQGQAGVGAARRALRHARVANDIARGTAERQLRAYVDIESVRIIDRQPPDQPLARVFPRRVISIVIKNYGQTPAKTVVLAGEIEIVDSSNVSIRHPSSKAHALEDRIQPSGSRELVIRLRANSDTVNNVRDGSKTIVLHTILSYETEFGQIETEANTLYSKGRLFDDGVMQNVVTYQAD